MQCAATPSDGDLDGPTVLSATTLTVEDTPPTAPVVTISPDPATTLDELVCSIDQPATDDDGDSITYELSWTVNSAPSGLTAAGLDSGGTLAVPALDTFEEEVWTCTAEATADGATASGGSDRLISLTGALAAWGATSSMLYPRSLHRSYTMGNYLYVFGGWDDQYAATDTVEFAIMETAGTSVWTETTSLPAALVRPVGTSNEGFFYIGGGAADVGYRDEFYVATHAAVGHIGAWTQTTDLPVPIISAGMVGYQDHLYLCGGWIAGNIRIPDCWYAPVNLDGTLGAWVSTEPLPDERYVFGFVAHDGFLYATGGEAQGDVPSELSWYSEVQPDGSLGPWQSGPDLPVAAGNAMSVVVDGFLYLVSSSWPTSPDQSFWSQIQEDGSPGPWSWTEGMPGERHLHGLGALDGRIYSTGGWGTAAGPSTTDVFWTERLQ